MFPNLQAEQARRGMTNQQVADFLGISRVAFESKKKSGRFYTLELFKLCTLFNCTFEYLFAVEENVGA